MAKHGDHPELPSLIEALLMEDVHTVFLKADCPPRVKRGKIGELKLVETEDDDGKWDNLRLESLQEELVDLANENKHRSDCFLEIDRQGCQVIQLGDLRIACAWPPFADAREITIVRPVAKLSLSDYELDKRLIDIKPSSWHFHLRPPWLGKNYNCPSYCRVSGRRSWHYGKDDGGAKRFAISRPNHSIRATGRRP